MFCLDYGLAEWWYCSLVADGIATNVFMGRCYSQCVCSGGMTTHSRCYVVADGKPLAECWQLLQPCGRWNSHFLGGFISILVLTC